MCAYTQAHTHTPKVCYSSGKYSDLAIKQETPPTHVSISFASLLLPCCSQTKRKSIQNSTLSLHINSQLVGKKEQVTIEERIYGRLDVHEVIYFNRKT